jgi:hypothetical protein
MHTIRKLLPTPAMLVACVALAVALGGVSYAAAVLPKNSVGTAQLKKKAVTGAKLKKNAVTGAKVKDRTLMAADFKAGHLPAGPQGPKGDTGQQGPRGETGPKGDTGAPGAVRAYALVQISGGVPSLGSAKNVTGVRRYPSAPVGAFCVEVSPAAGIATPNKAPAIAGGHDHPAIAATFQTVANSCDADEVAVGVFNDAGTFIDKAFTLLLP